MRALVFCCLLVAVASGCAPSAVRGTRAARAELAATFDRILAHPALTHSGSAVLVISLDRGDTLFAREADRLYTPASNLKLFTAASALHYLGPEYRFRTTLIATGPTAGDTLNGDLVLLGGGDPDLVTDDLAALVDTLAGRGVHVVAGDIVADDGWFAGPEWGSGWMWDDGPYWFWPYVSALSLNDNSVRVVVRPGAAPGAPARVRIAPPTGYVEVATSAVTGASDTDPTLDIERQWSPKANRIEVKGTVPLGADSIVAIRTVEDPPLYAATVLGELLEARGVVVLGDVRRAKWEASMAEASTADETMADTIATHVSDSLAVSLRNFLKASDNLTGEQLVKAIGAEAAGPPGTYENGLAAERAFLAHEVGIDTTAIRLADGSGVSRYNLVTAGQIVRLLAYMAGREDLSGAFTTALPIAGVDGTLEDRMRGTPAEGVVRAKTGSLSGVTALSGYVPTSEGERLAFGFLMEFFVGPTDPRRAVQDSLVVELTRFRR